MKSSLLLLLCTLTLAGCTSIREASSLKPRDDRGVSASTDPGHARLITSDIDRFWRIYDEATPGNSVHLFRENYLRGGSAGLQEFERLKIGNAANLVQGVWSHWRYYESVRQATESIRLLEPRFRESFLALKKIYPDATFPDVYFVVGAMNSGGISTGRGLVIGAELFTKTDASPLDELNSWERSVVRSIDRLPFVVAHELIHYQQQFGKETETLLERSIAEGQADFLTEIIAGSTINDMQLAYGERHEETLWNEFQKEMEGGDYSRWLYNGSMVAAAGNPSVRPSDLGYFVGYRICKSYYERAADKAKAVREMLRINDFGQFLRESGYRGQLALKAAAATATPEVTADPRSGKTESGAIGVTTQTAATLTH